MKKRALISVSNKENIVEFARGLIELDYEIISTGGTLKKLESANLPVQAVESVTDFPEILDGRVKTLHPNIHGALLAKSNIESHEQALKENNINRIDLVAVNLYPFKETLLNEEATEEDMIENIDIGGPTMLRAAAKNFQDVLVVVDPTDYEKVLTALQENNDQGALRRKLAAKVFRHTAAYDALIANYFTTLTKEDYPETVTYTYEKVQSLRYGENPHQHAAFYKEPISTSNSLTSAKQLHGKELSFNNIQDANAALEIVKEFDMPTVVAVKHMNPCGVGSSNNLESAFQKAYEADPISIFGGIIACNRPIDANTARKLSELFIEIIIAPSFSEEALEILTKKKNIRLLTLTMDEDASSQHKLVSVSGGLLIQEDDHGTLTENDLSYPTNKKPTEEQLADLMFAWKAVKHVKSNAIVLANDGQTIGIGAGQMNRIGAAKIAIEQANEKAKGSALASDAFFPMPDTVEAAAKAGVKAIIQPGGSNRDQASIDVCNEHDIAMVFTNMRHFKH